MDGGAWWAVVHGVAKSRTRLSDFTFTFHFHALEKEMAAHSSVLAWRIPGTEITPWGRMWSRVSSATQISKGGWVMAQGELRTLRSESMPGTRVCQPLG